MFFKRVSELSIPSSSSKQSSSSSPDAARRRRRQIAALSLAAAVASAPLVGGVPRMFAQDNGNTNTAAPDRGAEAVLGAIESPAADEIATPPADVGAPRPAPAADAAAPAAIDPVVGEAITAQAPVTLSDEELLRFGLEQYQKGQYEEAEQTLTQIKTAGLTDADRDRVVAALGDATKAANERRAAREQFNLGEDALRNQRYTEAAGHYQAAANNPFADPGTKAKSAEQIEAATRLAGGTPAPAVEQPAVVAAPAVADSGLPKMNARGYYKQAQKLYKQGDWPAARQYFVAAQDAGFRAGLFEDSPRKYLERMDKKETADRQKNEARIAREELAQAQAAEERRQQEELTRQMAQDTGVAPVNPPTEVPPIPPTDVVPPVPPTDVPPVPPTDVPPVPPADVVPVVPLLPPGADAEAQAELERTARAEDLRETQNRRDAIELVRRARNAQANNDTATAKALYQEAVALDPNNAQAQQGLDQVLAIRGERPVVGDRLTREAEMTEAIRAEIRYRFDSAIERVRRASASIANVARPLDQGEIQAGQTSINQAQLVRNQNPTVFTPDELEQFDTTLANARLDFDQALERRTRQEITEENERARIAAEEGRRNAEEQRRRTVAGLVKLARELTDRAQYQQALGTVEQILTIEPTNDYAIGVRPLLLDKLQFSEQRLLQERREREFTNQLNNAIEAQIPYDDILRYPSDWPDISQTREQTTSLERGERAEDRAVIAQLDRALPELAFDGVGFSDVVDFLRDVSSANIFVNWKALEAAGIDRNAPVTARLRNVKFSKALRIILDSVGSDTAKLGYTVDEGVITISTAEDLSGNTLTRVYDIRDLILQVPDFTDAPNFSLQSTATQGGGGGGGGGAGGGGGLFGNSGSEEEEEEGLKSRDELVEEITKLVQDTVDPDSWRDNGGTVGAIRELSGQLIVTQTPENQRQLVNLLEQLRETRAIQVTVEARFLTVQRNFLEDVGVDLDFVFNTDAGSDANFSQVAVSQGSSTFTLGPTTSVPGSIGAQAQGLTASATFLDDFQVNMLLRAVQASRSSTLVTAPRVTLFNGQRAYVLVANQRAYVSDLTPQVGTGVALFDPEISIVESGVVLDVAATVSSDRKYVTLTLRPQLSTLVQLAQFTFQSGGGTQQTGVDTDGDGIPDVVNNANSVGSGIVQQPEIQLTEVRTTVSVPDGGTLLLGGQTVAGEIELEAGVPVLSKIPFLKRLFTNRSMAKDEFVLLILVRPTIIIQREVEQKQFPLLSTRLGQ